MKENVFENPVEVRSTAPAPHFADQSVVQRAQPVVPLDEIRTKVRLRRIWFLGGAFLLAIVLGAASALVAVRLKSTTTTQSEPNIPVTETVATQTDPPPVEETPVVEEAVAEEETEPEPSIEPEITPTPAKQNPAPQRARVAEREYEPLEPERRRRERERGEPSEEEQLQQIRESVLYERWQERRARRAERREQRRNRRGGDRDLTHVDELFEGPRRPERPRY